jgi:hypothetical protein
MVELMLVQKLYDLETLVDDLEFILEIPTQLKPREVSCRRL